MPDIIPEQQPVQSSSSGVSTMENRFRAVTLKRNDFIKEIDTGLIINDKNKEVGRKNEHVTFSEDLRQQYSTFLDNYVRNLIEIQNKDRTFLETKSRIQDKLMLNLLSSEEKDPQGRAITTQEGWSLRKVDEAKIQQFLETQQGWTLANMALEQYTSMMMFALSLEASIVPEGDRDKLLRNFKIDNGINQGAFWKWAANRRPPIYPEKPGFFKRGKRTEIKPNPDVLLAMKNNPEEAKFIWELTGIDVDDFTIDPVTGEVIANAGVKITDAVEEKQKSIIGNLKSRQQFYESLGIPSKQLDAMDSQFIYSYVNGSSEEIPTHVHQRIIDRFKPNRTIVDAAGLHPGEPGFDPNTVNVEEVLQKYLKVKRDIFVRLAQEAVARQVQGTEDLSKSLTVIRTALEDVRKGREGTIAQRRNKEAQERIGVLEKEKHEISEKRRPLEEFAEKQKAVQQTVKELSESYGVNIPAGSDFETTVTTELNTIQNQIEGVTPPGGGARAGGIEQQIEQERLAMQNWIDTQTNAAIAARVGALGGRGSLPQSEITNIVTGYRETAESSYGARIQRLEAQKRQLEERRNNLNTLLSRNRNAVREERESEQKIVNQAPKELDAMRASYELVVNSAGATITADMLENRNVDQLIPLLTAAPYNQPNTTPEQQAALRELVIRAKTELKGERQEGFEPSPANQTQEYNDIINQAGATITSNDLLSLSDQEIENRLTQPPYNFPAAGIHDRINLARAEAQKKLRIRYAVLLDERESDLGNQIKQLEDKMKSQTSFDREEKILQTAERAISRQEEVFTNAIDIVSDIGRYTKVDHVTNADTTYSESERAAGYSKGYYELMDYLFSYQENPDISDRNEYFQAIQESLPPEKLAVILNERLNLRLIPVPPGFVGPLGANMINLENVFQRMSRKKLSPRDMQRTLSDVIIRLKDEAIAIV